MMTPRFGFLAFLTLLIPTLSHSASYPLRDIHPDNIKVINHGKIEAKLRLRAIRQAMKTIDVIDYDSGSDPLIAQPFFEALRYAADRGVRVRFIRGGYFSKLYRKFYKEPSWNDPVEDAIYSPTTKNPIQYVFFGGWKMLSRGWSVLAGVHEKLLIIDNKIVFMTGRGLSKIYLDFQDHCTIFKGTGHDDLVSDATLAFEEVWKTVHREVRTRLPTSEIPSSETIEQPVLNFTQDPLLPLSPRESRALKRYKNWINQPAQAPISKRSSKARLIHNDVLNQLSDTCRRSPWFYGYSSCTNKLRDPIVNEFIELLQQGATEAKFFTLGLGLPDDLKNALLARLHEERERKKTGNGRKFELTIFTNSKETYQSFVFWPLSKIAWKSGLKDMDLMLQSGANIIVFERRPEVNSLQYVHEKGAFLKMPEGESVVITGSSNLNKTSSTMNDEMDIAIYDSDIHRTYENLFNSGVVSNGRSLDPEVIHREQWWNSLPLWGYDSLPWSGIFRSRCFHVVMGHHLSV